MAHFVCTLLQFILELMLIRVGLYALMWTKVDPGPTSHESSKLLIKSD